MEKTNKFMSTIENLIIIRKFFLQNLIANEENWKRKLFHFIIIYIYIYICISKKRKICEDKKNICYFER